MEKSKKGTNLLNIEKNSIVCLIYYRVRKITYIYVKLTHSWISLNWMDSRWWEAKKAPLARNFKNKFPKVIALLYSFDCHSPIH